MTTTFTEKSLVERIVECFAGPVSTEISDKTVRLLAFLAEKRAKAQDPDDCWDEIYGALQENEELDPELDDVMAHIFERCGVTDPEFDEDEDFSLAFEQFFDVYLSNQ